MGCIIKRQKDKNVKKGSFDMAKSKVYYTDFRTKLGEGLPTKLKRLIKKAGIGVITLANRAHPTRQNNKLLTARDNIHNLALQATDETFCDVM